MGEWRTIDSAPKDGSEILAVYDGRVYIARWSSVWAAGNEMWVVDNPFSDPQTVSCLGPELDSEGAPSSWGRDGPTHWQPLPRPPRTDADERA